MQIAILLLAVTVIILAMVLWAQFSTKNSAQNEGNIIINKFEPDNDSPTLTEMISFHKENGTVEYEI